MKSLRGARDSWGGGTVDLYVCLCVKIMAIANVLSTKKYPFKAYLSLALPPPPPKKHEETSWYHVIGTTVSPHGIPGHEYNKESSLIPVL